MRRQAASCSSFHSPVQPGVIRASRPTQVISVKISQRRRARASRNAPDENRPERLPSAEYMHIGDTTARLASSISRRRSGWNIGASGLFDIDVKPAGANLSRKGLVDLGDEVGRPQGQVVVGDRLRTRHHAERELHGIELPEAVDMLEPDQRNIGGMLGLLDLLAPSLLVLLQGRRHASARAAWRPPARWRLPSRAWCRNRSRNARSPWRRRAAPCCP